MGSSAKQETPSGKKLYKKHCQKCHRKSGKGLGKSFPPLTDPKWTGDDYKIISNMVNGLSGKIDVLGKTYDKEMPAFDYLTNEEMALVIDHIRKSFLADSSGISIEWVKAIRQELKKG